MADYLLDTNHASPLVTIGHPLRAMFSERREAGDTFALCVPVIVETKFGIGILPRAKANLEEWQRLKPLLTVYAADANDAELAVIFSLLCEKTVGSWRVLSALIAAIALRYRLTLLTTDRDFQTVEGLLTENWLARLA
ncbi:MAG: type II toxin-antitoxin system VapC family toxin [Caldilineaceae bacterium]